MPPPAVGGTCRLRSAARADVDEERRGDQPAVVVAEPGGSSIDTRTVSRGFSAGTNPAKLA